MTLSRVDAASRPLPILHTTARYSRAGRTPTASFTSAILDCNRVKRTIAGQEYCVVSITWLPGFLHECSIRSSGLPFTSRTVLRLSMRIRRQRAIGGELDSIFMPAYAPFSRVDNVAAIIRAIRFLLRLANRTQSNSHKCVARFSFFVTQPAII